MTPIFFRSARVRLGYSEQQLAHHLKLGRWGQYDIERWEDPLCKNDIPGPICLAMKYLIKFGPLDPREIPTKDSNTRLLRPPRTTINTHRFPTELHEAVKGTNLSLLSQAVVTYDAGIVDAWARFTDWNAEREGRDICYTLRCGLTNVPFVPQHGIYDISGIGFGKFLVAGEEE